MESSVRYGTTIWKRSSSLAGYTLYAPLMVNANQLDQNHCSQVYLIDMNGRYVYSWAVPGILKMNGQLLDNGQVLCGILDPNMPHNVKNLYSANALITLNPAGQVIWRYDNPDMDGHDYLRLDNGHIIIQERIPLDQAMQDRVQGGTSLDAPLEMDTVRLKEIDPATNRVLWEVALADCLDTEIDCIAAHNSRDVYPGISSIKIMPDGQLLLASYNLSEVLLLDREKKQITWRFGHMKGESIDKISYPTSAIPLRKGHIQIYDTGRFHSPDPSGALNLVPPDFSRIITVDTKTSKIIWEYRDENPVDFYSTYAGNTQRLANGNFMVCEGAYGRLFEINHRGEVVWEFLSPIYRDTKDRFGKTNAVYSCYRFTADHPGINELVFDDEKMQHLNDRYGPKPLLERFSKAAF